MLEVKIEELTKAVLKLTEILRHAATMEITNRSLKIAAESVREDELTTETVPFKEAVNIGREAMGMPPKYEIDPKIKVEAPAAPVMPDAPTFEPVAAEPAGAKAPFTDGKGLIDYVMTVYKELGAEKGAGIQGVLTEMGLANVNEVRATEYDTFFAKVEALK